FRKILTSNGTSFGKAHEAMASSGPVGCWPVSLEKSTSPRAPSLESQAARSHAASADGGTTIRNSTSMGGGASGCFRLDEKATATDQAGQCWDSSLMITRAISPPKCQSAEFSTFERAAWEPRKV